MWLGLESIGIKICLEKYKIIKIPWLLGGQQINDGSWPNWDISIRFMDGMNSMYQRLRRVKNQQMRGHHQQPISFHQGIC